MHNAVNCYFYLHQYQQKHLKMSNAMNIQIDSFLNHANDFVLDRCDDSVSVWLRVTLCVRECMCVCVCVILRILFYLQCTLLMRKLHNWTNAHEYTESTDMFCLISLCEQRIRTAPDRYEIQKRQKGNTKTFVWWFSVSEFYISKKGLFSSRWTIIYEYIMMNDQRNHTKFNVSERCTSVSYTYY